MRDRPLAGELLAVARSLLRDELLPLLPPERRLDGLMVANAMAIAARQIATGDLPEAEERASLQALLGSPEDDLLELNRELASRIRAGTIGPRGRSRAPAPAAHRCRPGRRKQPEGPGAGAEKPKLTGPASGRNAQVPTRKGETIPRRQAMTLSPVIRPVRGLSGDGIFSIFISKRALSASQTIR